MRFSIIIPIYNVDKYIKQCIESVLAQNYIDYELVLVNDGSDDQSKEICEEYVKQFNNIILINKKNGGSVSARKAGAEAASGDYIVCLDGDDYIHHEMLSKISEAIDKNPETDVVCFGYYKDRSGVISEPVLNQLPAGEYHNLTRIRESYLYDSSKKEDNIGNLIYSIWCKTICRDIFLPCQMAIPDDIKNGEDILLTAHVLSRAKSLTVLSFAGYYYRENPASLTHVRSARDLVNITNVKNQIENLGAYSEMNIAHFYISSIYVLTCDLAKTSSDYMEFIDILKSLSFDKKYKYKRAYNKYLSLRQRMKFILVQREMWFTLFHISRMVRV